MRDRSKISKVLSRIRNLKVIQRLSTLLRSLWKEWRLRCLRFCSDTSGCVVKRVYGSWMRLDVRPSTSHTLEIKLALNRNYDPAPTSAYIKELKRMAEVARPFGVLAIDVGANIGFFTLLQAGVLGSQAKVIAIEPESDNIERLKANINLNHYSNIEVIQASIGAEKGVGILRTRSHLGQERHKMSEIMPQGEAAGSQPVTVLTIDDMVQTYSDKEHVPVAIRMDIEGYEGFAFRGMKGLFASSRPCSLFMEIHPGSVSPSFIVDVLQSSRFEIDWISKDGKTIQTNATFKDVQGLTTTADILLHRNGAVVAAGAG